MVELEQLLASGGFKSVATEQVQPLEKLLEHTTIEVGEGTMQDKISETRMREEEKSGKSEKSAEKVTERPGEPLKVVVEE